MNLTVSGPSLLGFFIGLVVAAIAAAPLMKLLIKLKSRQTISAYVAEHQAKQGTPTMGGLIVVVGGVITWLALAISGVPNLIEPLVLFIGFAAIGFIDDYVVPRMLAGKRGLGWKQKILMELGFALIPMLVFEHRSPASMFVGVLLVLGLANAYNFTDGLDGLAGSVGVAMLGGLALACAGVGALSTDLLLCLTMAGALIPFLWLNAPPAKVFMGDVGSMPIGAVVGLVFWRLYAFDGASLVTDAGVFLMSLVMCAELFPVPIQIASVKLRKKKVFFMTPIHHGFQKKGMPETAIVWRYALVQLVISVAGAALFLWGRSIVGFSLNVSLR